MSWVCVAAKQNASRLSFRFCSVQTTHLLGE
jgi:hypothetical protein